GAVTMRASCPSGAGHTEYKPGERASRQDGLPERGDEEDVGDGRQGAACVPCADSRLRESPAREALVPPTLVPDRWVTGIARGQTNERSTRVSRRDGCDPRRANDAGGTSGGRAGSDSAQPRVRSRAPREQRGWRRRSGGIGVTAPSSGSTDGAGRPRIDFAP